MLSKEDLQAISELMDAKLQVSEQRTDAKLQAMEQRITKSMVALMDAEFKPKFELLAEGQRDILEKLVPRSRVDDLEEEIKFLKSYIRRMNEDIQELKKAQ